MAGRSTKSEFDKLQRVRYFDGMLMTVNTFVREQTYFIEKHRRHNRFLHGLGVVKGFEVSFIKGKLLIGPGMAIDCAGNDIFLGEQKELIVPIRAQELYVVVEYSEIESNPVPNIISECADEAIVTNSLIQEDCRVYFMGSNPNLNHDGIGPGTCGCGSPHSLSIARLQKVYRRWKLNKCGQRLA